MIISPASTRVPGGGCHFVEQLLEHLFAECELYGQALIAEGVITSEDVQGSKSGKSAGGTVRVGLPAYAILQALLRSAKADADGILLSDGTEITTANKPKDTFFDWFFDPLLIMKQQIGAENLTDDEEEYLCMLVLLAGDSFRVKQLNSRPPAAAHGDCRRAELDAVARRLQGITKSISRYPTYRRQFDGLVRSLSDKLEGRMSGPRARARSGLTRLISDGTHQVPEKDCENGV